MKTWQKVSLGVGGVVVLGGIVLFSIKQANKGVVTVQTAKVASQDTLISQVTASGEIKPTTYTNVTAQGFGRITKRNPRLSILPKWACKRRRPVSALPRLT
jgi:HlyD family secretion protein